MSIIYRGDEREVATSTVKKQYCFRKPTSLTSRLPTSLPWHKPVFASQRKVKRWRHYSYQIYSARFRHTTHIFYQIWIIRWQLVSRLDRWAFKALILAMEMHILLYARKQRRHNFAATFFAQGFTFWHKPMVHSGLRRFKGSQKVHKGSQQNVNPLRERYNKCNTLNINKLLQSNCYLCDTCVNPLKYTTYWFSWHSVWFVNPYNNYSD